MITLSFESTCDETSAAVTDGRRVLSCVTATQIDTHRLYGGVVPEIASRLHVESIVGVCDEALRLSTKAFGDVELIAAAAAPGLIGAVLVGLNFGKGLSLSTGLPFIAVDHIRAHVAANYIDHDDLEPPFACLVASGGHTQILRVDDYTSFTPLAGTHDDAAGECLDKTARVLGLPYPGGAAIELLAQDGDPHAIPLPRPRYKDSLDMSFSGLKTHVVNLVHNAQQKGEPLRREDVAASVQWAVVDILGGRLIEAAKQNGLTTVALAGGVVANGPLRRHVEQLCKEQGFSLYMPELKYCGDNAAMIGVQAGYEFERRGASSLSQNGYATWDVEKSL